MSDCEKDLVFFSGSSNPALGKKITECLGVPEGKITIKKFSNGETYVQFLENIREKDVFLMQTATEPINDNLMELLIMIDAAKRASAGRITAVMPQFFYARQDRKSASREPITAKLVADMLTTAGANRILTIDLHSDQTQGFFNIPFDNLPTSAKLIEIAKQFYKEDSIIVAPDAGAAKKATKIAQKLGLGIAIINKIRIAHNKAQALNILGDNVSKKSCFIFDDMIDTGESLCKAINLIKENGAEHTYAFITHGILSGSAIELINSSKLDKLYITDTLPNLKQSPKIEIVSIADYLAKAIKNIHENRSVSTLFD